MSIKIIFLESIAPATKLSKSLGSGVADSGSPWGSSSGAAAVLRCLDDFLSF